MLGRGHWGRGRRIFGYGAVLGALLAVCLVGPVYAAPDRLGHQGRWITDGQGRVVMLHGVNNMRADTYPPYAPGVV
ncbi:MAG: hypothetical protein QOD76_2204, partial [Solirubrobacteraceae bacterium]|nr:hypothetical protein [Solirubrobacteraceae bacterium]